MQQAFIQGASLCYGMVSTRSNGPCIMGCWLDVMSITLDLALALKVP